MMKKFLITTLALCCAACNSDWRKQYDEVLPTRTENMMVRKGDKYGLVNPKGLEITPVKYDYIDTNPPRYAFLRCYYQQFKRNHQAFR